MYETLRIVNQIKPKFVLWENVKNILSKKHKHNFDKYLEKMEQLGYKNYYQILNAKDYEIPQNRERVYTISIRKDIDDGKFEFPKREVLFFKLKDTLEDKVDEKYYLNSELTEKFIFNRTNGNVIGNLNIKKWQDNMKRIYDINTYAPTINTCQGGNTEPKILIKNATKKGYDKATNGDSINLQYPNSTTRRGRVGHQVSQTLMANDNMGVIENLRIRKLTPKECWRLMGFSDEDFEKVKNIPMSNTQLYKQAGNSIVVNVLERIFGNLWRYKMTRADKMFEKSGYEKIEEKDYIGYTEKTEASPFRIEIYFHTDKKVIQIYGCINTEELQAINEKVKELGWNE